MSDTAPPPAFQMDEAPHRTRAVQRKPEWVMQSELHHMLDKIVAYPREIRGIDKSSAAHANPATKFMALGRGIKDGTGDHLVIQGEPLRVVFIECKTGQGRESPAQAGSAVAYARCGVPTIRNCRTMAQAVQGLREAGFRLHGGADNIAAYYQERVAAGLRELALKPKPKKAGAQRARKASPRDVQRWRGAGGWAA